MTDAVLVRAPIGVTYRTLTDLDAWPGWLHGCASRRAEPAEVSDHHLLVLPGLRRPVRLRVTAHGWRHDAGLRWDVSWDERRSAGTRVEWWLEGRREGVVVHHLVLDVPTGRRDERAVLRYRRAVMLAMQAMKDHLELAVAVATGRVP